VDTSSRRSPVPPRTIGAAIGVIGISNIVTNLRLPAALYVPWNLSMATGLVVLARSAGCDPTDLGLDRRHLRGSLRAGGLGASLVVAGCGVLLITGVAPDMFRDDRATSPTTRGALWQLFVRIPLGTVVAEETVFRGVLPALFARPARPPWFPGTLSSFLFGLWHLLPSLEMAASNVAMSRFAQRRRPGSVAALAFGTTTLAGGVLHLLRNRTGHLAAPMLVHLAANAMGFLSARLTGSPA
jgi:membrane protease YdiL (CAAX protease family)